MSEKEVNPPEEGRNTLQKVKDLITLKQIREIWKYSVYIHKEVLRIKPISYVVFLLAFITLESFSTIINYLNAQIVGKAEDYLRVDSFDISSPEAQALIFAFGLLALGWLARSFFGMIQNYLSQSLSFDMRKHFSDLVVQKLLSIDTEQHEDPKIKDSISLVRESYAWIPRNILQTSIEIIAVTTQLLVTVGIVINIDFIVFPILLVFSIPGIVNNSLHQQVRWDIDKNHREGYRLYWDLSWMLQEQKFAMEVRSYNLSQKLSSFVKILYDDLTNLYSGALFKHQVLGRTVTNIFDITGLVIAGWIVVDQFLNQVIGIEELTFYLATITMFRGILSSLTFKWTDLYGYMKYSKEIKTVLELEPAIKNGDKGLDTSLAHPPRIEFKNVWFKYPTSKEYVFKNMNFVIEPGENIALVGKNGAGKSTFIKLLCRFYTVTKGEILIDGININDLDISSWYDRLSILSQDFNHYPLPAKSNIAIGAPDTLEIISDSKDPGKIHLEIHTDRQKRTVPDAAKLSGAHSFIEDLEFGYDTKLSKSFTNGTELSGGQWQKVALARAFYKNAPVLILDEPTSAIDPKSEFEIFNNIMQQDKIDDSVDQSIIIVSHRFSTVRNANKIFVFENGKIIEHGSHAQLMELDGVYKEAFDIQKQGYQ